MSDQRERIRDHVATNPGLHFNALARALDLAPGHLQHHLRTLERDERVVDESIYGRTHYFPPEYDASQRRALAVVRRETARDVLVTLLERGPSDPATVAAEVGVARSTLEWHLDHLTEQGLVEKRRDERHRVTLVVADPESAALLLDAITPSLPERMVDRFTRLVDALLAEGSVREERADGRE